MRVHVEGDLYIAGDKFGFTIEKKTIAQTGENAGKEVFLFQGQYSSLRAAILQLVKMKLADSTVSTLSELLSEIKRFQTEIEAQVAI